MARILCETCDICGEASDGQEAVDKVAELRPDLVILDVSMPVMDGVTAAREIRRIAPETKIVFVSMYEAQFSKQELISTGGDAVVSKRSAATELYQAIGNALKIPYDTAEKDKVTSISEKANHIL
jgi:DNA-binding NarL/FixJ family response regulator